MYDIVLEEEDYISEEDYPGAIYDENNPYSADPYSSEITSSEPFEIDGFEQLSQAGILDENVTCMSHILAIEI